MHSGDFKRILIVKTDTLGDVVLTTPVIRALRENYPQAYIAIMVKSYTKDIVEGNPNLNEVILYDQEGKDKGWLKFIKAAFNLKCKRFDLAIILHLTRLLYPMAFIAGIPKRIGYDCSLGFLLTDRLKDIRRFSEKHESEYLLDSIRYLGYEPKDKNLTIPIKIDSEKWLDELFKQVGIKATDKLLAIHPAAGRPSKIWPSERFAEVADRLIEEYGLKVLCVAGPKDIRLTQNVIDHMKQYAFNLAGRTTISQLASILRRCRLLISNDSGPVHIASAIGTPVIAIFGRNREALSPARWGPVGNNDRVLHKTVGCVECLANNCRKGFACLKAINVDDVLNIAHSILR